MAFYHDQSATIEWDSYEFFHFIMAKIATYLEDKNKKEPGQPVNPRLHENEPELGILVLPVPLQVLADRDGLLDKKVDVLRELGGHALGLQHAEDLVPSHKPNL